MTLTKKQVAALTADLAEVLAKHGLTLLGDDGVSVYIDDHSDAWTVYFRPANYLGLDKPWCNRAGDSEA